MNTSEVLNLAADLIEERGWATAGMQVGGPHCALGGIAAAAGTSIFEAMGIYHYREAEQHPAGRALMAHAECSSNIPFWNDKRTASEVIEALRACAVIEAAKESASQRESVAVCA